MRQITNKQCAVTGAITLLLLVASCGGAKSSKSSSEDDARAASVVRAAVPAVEAYYQDHNSYLGMTAAKVRNYDSSVGDISISKVGKETYCIEAVSGDSHAFKVGPAGEILLGSCSDPASGKPLEQPETSSSESKLAGPDTALLASIPAIEAYRYDHNGYQGMTLEKLRQGYDAGLADIEIVSATKSAYCVELTVNGSSAFVRGLETGIEPGNCPR
jgi:hypothetical protein